ncbi:SAM-dependent methyltransferase [Nocardiopsis potens]|uniref:SAM-dependent methyltransferase n=1 Tax=Nocardiopsis potens TaxID=1246458 RepID=UPI00034D4557|nr:SAM-dependent methyltransferase [Nocardiopsis potens]
MTDEWPVPHLVEDPMAVGVPRPRVVGLDGRPVDGADGAAPPRPAADPADRARLAFAARAAHYLAADAGIRQFVDFSSGLPTCDALHGVLGERSPAVRTVYVEAACGIALHPGASPHRAAAPVLSLRGRTPEAAAAELAASGLVDFGEPVGVLLLDTAPQHRAPGAVDALLRALHREMAPGGHVIASFGPRAPHTAGPGPAPARLLAPFTPLDPGTADIAWWPYPDDAVATEGTGITGGMARRDPGRG